MGDDTTALQYQELHEHLNQHLQQDTCDHELFDNYSAIVSDSDKACFVLKNAGFVCFELLKVVPLCLLEDTNEFISS